MKYHLAKPPSRRRLTGGSAMVALLFAWLGSSIALAASATATVDHLYDNASDGSPVISLIQKAKKTIDIEIYTMKDVNVINELKAAMGRGVKLRIIQAPNPVLDTCAVFKEIAADTDPACVVLRSFVTYVNDHGGTYIPFSFDLCGREGYSCYQHGKMVLVDKKQALISTGNFDTSNLCDLPLAPSRCNRDYSVVTTDTKVIKTLGKVFDNDVKGIAYDLKTILGDMDRVTASPYSMQPLIDFINSAKKSIQLQNQYLNDPTLNQALIDAAGRGVKVFVQVASVTAFGKLNPDDDHAKIDKWTATFTSFDQAGISTRIFDDQMKINGQAGYLHSKTILVDGKRAWVGSVNGSTKSLTQNREFGIFSEDKVFVKHLNEVMYADFTNRDSETWKQSLVCKKDACGRSHAPVIPNNEGSEDDSSEP
jgi:cardiolipin synthase